MIRCKNCGGRLTVSGAGNNIGWVHLELYDEEGKYLNCDRAEPEI